MRIFLTACLVGCAANPDPLSWRPESLVACSAQLDLIGPGPDGDVSAIPDGTPETGFEYEIVQYTNGDSEVSCTVAIGWEKGGSGSGYFPAPTAGARSHTCIASANFPGGADLAGGGWIFTGNARPSAVHSRSLHDIPLRRAAEQP